MRTRKDHLLIVVFSVAKETSCTANANPGNKCIKYAANKAFLSALDVRFKFVFSKSPSGNESVD